MSGWPLAVRAALWTLGGGLLLTGFLWLLSEGGRPHREWMQKHCRPIRQVAGTVGWSSHGEAMFFEGQTCYACDDGMERCE